MTFLQAVFSFHSIMCFFYGCSTFFHPEVTVELGLARACPDRLSPLARLPMRVSALCIAVSLTRLLRRLLMGGNDGRHCNPLAAQGLPTPKQCLWVRVFVCGVYPYTWLHVLQIEIGCDEKIRF